MKTTSITKHVMRFTAVLATLLIAFQTAAQESPAVVEAAAEKSVKTHSLFDSSLFVAMFVISMLLAFVIIVFAQVAKATIKIKMEKRLRENPVSGVIKTVVLLGGISFLSGNVFGQTDSTTTTLAQTGSAAVDKYPYWGMDASTFWVMLCAIALELFVIRQLYNIIMQQLGVTELREKLAEEKRTAKVLVKQPTFIEKLNRSVAIEKEADIMLDHNYDGIHELDNNLPPWWKYGFYLTIIFSFVYMTHYHITKTGNLQTAEYNHEILQAKHEMEEYRKKAANLVDENNAELLTDPSSIASGKALFTTNCVACHGNAGEGGVGPNLTDEFWLHMGSIKDVFKTIKYGYPEKGMKSWQQDLGAKQIHEVASYVLSLQGTHPSNAKEPEGDLYKTTNTDTVQ